MGNKAKNKKQQQNPFSLDTSSYNYYNNTNQEVICITEDKLKVILMEHKEKNKYFYSWTTPLGIFLSCLLATITSNFEENFDMEKFHVFAKGFIEGCGGRLPKEEIELLPEGALMMTLECGMRFLTDYLDGDVYFRTAYPEHNLVRSRTQFKLASEMEKHWDEMKKTVIECANDI